MEICGAEAGDDQQMKRISIVGLGYVGLPLALQFARSGAEVTGVDINPIEPADKYCYSA